MKRKKHSTLTITPKGGLNKTGPKRIFTSEDLRNIEWLAKLGATNEQFAMFFEVTSVSTIEYWMKKYPEYRNAVKKGGLEADMKVAQSLYKRAVGYSYIEEEYTAIEVDGKKMPMDQMCLVKRTKKTLPPDVKAASKWLSVRQRTQWTVVPETILRHTGNVNHLHRKLQEIPIQELTPAAQEMLFEITQKQLTTDTN